MISSADITAALTRLETELGRAGPAFVAVSGGVDSRFLALVCRRLGMDVHAVHFTGLFMNPDESREAVEWLKAARIPTHVLRVDPLQLPAVASGARERCYHCKRLLYATALDLAQPLGRNALLEGSNVSDRQEYRPGAKALAELGILSPLAEAGFGKELIRAAGRELGLDNPDQPSRPCLLTRMGYGMKADADVLARLAQAESALKELGLKEFRLRLTSEGPVLFVGPNEPELGNKALAAMLAAGFAGSLRRVDRVSGHFDRKT